jgi:hypothetical protein
MNEFLETVEKLARGIYTKTETLVSLMYVEQVEKLLRKNECIEDDRDVNMGTLIKCLNNRDIPIETFNQILQEGGSFNISD